MKTSWNTVDSFNLRGEIEKKFDWIEVYGGQRSLALELTTTIIYRFSQG